MFILGGDILNLKCRLILEDYRKQRDDWLADANTQLLEQLSILGLLDRGERRTENLDTTLIEDTLLWHLPAIRRPGRWHLQPAR